MTEIHKEYIKIQKSHEKIMEILLKHEASIEENEGYFFHDKEVLNKNFEEYSIELQTTLKDAERRLWENNNAN